MIFILPWVSSQGLLLMKITAAILHPIVYFGLFGVILVDTRQAHGLHYWFYNRFDLQHFNYKIPDFGNDI
ncbi:MAG: hypothetical protein LC657_13100 [Desulfobacteraceae bacterium]|nr:hypothetical protein [Desulfobacteraceae bacterium]